MHFTASQGKKTQKRKNEITIYVDLGNELISLSSTLIKMFTQEQALPIFEEMKLSVGVSQIQNLKNKKLQWSFDPRTKI